MKIPIQNLLKTLGIDNLVLSSEKDIKRIKKELDVLISEEQKKTSK